MAAPPEAPKDLPPNWATDWENSNLMAFFFTEEPKDDGVFRVYVVNKDTLKLYYVVDFPNTCPEFGSIRYQISCVYSRGKLYLVGDRHPNDVHVCDLSSKPPYVWIPGPPMRSPKHYPHLVAYNGMIFALGKFDKLNHGPWNPIANFEVWDTSVDTSTDSWEVLPDPPLENYNFSDGPGPYEVKSHTVSDGMLYYVFDYTKKRTRLIRYEDTLNGSCTYLCYNKVEAFDPKLKQWARPHGTSFADSDSDSESDSDTSWYKDDEEDADDMLSMLINFSARRHEAGVEVVEFFEGDPNRRMFLLDPPGEDPLPPCFYTYDHSTFDTKSILRALREFQHRFDTATPQGFLEWFQAFVRPYLSSVTGLTELMYALRLRKSPGGHNCFVLPCSYGPDYWIFCVVAFFDDNFTTIAKFRLTMTTNNCFQARDLEMQQGFLPNQPVSGGYFYRIQS